VEVKSELRPSALALLAGRAEISNIFG
jgi:hypothetical protein